MKRANQMAVYCANVWQVDAGDACVLLCCCLVRSGSNQLGRLGELCGRGRNQSQAAATAHSLAECLGPSPLVYILLNVKGTQEKSSKQTHVF